MNSKRIIANIKFIIFDVVQNASMAVHNPAKTSDKERIDFAVGRVLEDIEKINVLENADAPNEALALTEAALVMFYNVKSELMLYADEALLTIFNKLMDLRESALLAIEDDFIENLDEAINSGK
jgi:hypothetical protein